MKPNPDNPNRHSAHQISLLASIIQEQGWRAPITVSKRSGLVVRGHGRLEAALLLGLTQVPVDEQEYESEADELADLVADNRLAELAELDESGLRGVMEKIRAATRTSTVELTGFQEDEIARLFVEDEVELGDEETIPKMECQAFEHHDYLVFMFHDLRDWMQAVQLLGVKQVDASISQDGAEDRRGARDQREAADRDLAAGGKDERRKPQRARDRAPGALTRERLSRTAAAGAAPGDHVARARRRTMTSHRLFPSATHRGARE